MERKKPFSFKLTKQDKMIGAVVAVALVACGVDLSISRIKAGNELAYKLGVKDAGVVGEQLESPYKLTNEKFEQIIKEDKYISSKYDLSDRTSSSITNIDNRELYSISKSKSIIGLGEDTNDLFQSGATLYNNFDKPTSLTLMYPYSDDSELSSIKDSYSNIISKMFNKDITKYINKNSLDTFRETIPSKSGDYKLEIFKGVQDNGDMGKELIIVIDYNESNPDSREVSAYKGDEETVYNKLPIFNDIKLEDMAETYSKSLGEHKESRLTHETSDASVVNGVKSSSSSIGLRTVYRDNSATELSLGIFETEDSATNTITTSISAMTSTNYKGTRQETIQDAELVLSSITGLYRELDDYLDKSDVYNGEVEVMYGEETIEVSLTVQILEDIYGTYSTISLYN